MCTPARTIAAALVLSPLALSQSGPADELWLTGDAPQRIDRFGIANGPILMPAGSEFRRSPTGDVWFFGAAGRAVGVLDAGGGRVWTSLLPTLVGEIVVDARGHGWIGRVDGVVQEFDAAGVAGTSFTLAGAVRVGAVDETGRLWFAVDNHPAGLLSWRDPASAQISTVSVPLGLGQVVDLELDGRTGGSHPWLIGDAGNAVVEIDRQGMSQRTWRVGPTTNRLHALAFAPDGTLRVSSEQGLFALDPATGATQLLLAESAADVAFDGKGAMWAAVPLLGLLLKADPQTAEADLRLSTPGLRLGDDPAGFEVARIVAPNADFDRDGHPNRAETDSGSNPFDALSLPSFHVRTERFEVPPGENLEIRAFGSLGWGFVLFGTDRLPTPTPVAGIAGGLALQNVIPLALPMPVPGSLTLTVPPALSPAAPIWMQVLRLPIGVGAPRLSEVVGVAPTPTMPGQVVETFDSDANLDAARSSGTWSLGVARPGPIGGIGRLGSFDWTLGREVAPGVFEFDTTGQVFPASSTLFGAPVLVADGQFDFTDLSIPAGITVRFVGERPVVLRVRGDATIDGAIDVSGANVSAGFHAKSPRSPLGQPPIGANGQPGSAGGPGAGDGGRGADACLGGGAVGSEFDGAPGEDLMPPLLSAYRGHVTGTGGPGGRVWPASGRRSAVVFNLFFTFTGQVPAGAGGGGYLTPGGVGRAIETFTSVASDLQTDTPGGTSVGFRLAPPGVGTLHHYLVGGSGGGGGGSHVLNMTTSEVNGDTVFAPSGWRAGAGGAGGGGAIGLRIGGDLAIGTSGAVVGSGGDGAFYDSHTFGPPSPGGGGSGGSVLLQVARTVAQHGVIEVAGGTGGRLRHPQFNGEYAEAVGGDGAPGYVRLELPGGAALSQLGTVVGPSIAGENVGVLTDRDVKTGQVSEWYHVRSAVPPNWQHYTLAASVNGLQVVFSDDPTLGNPATGPGVPVQLWVQGARLDIAGQPIGEPGPWRPYVRDLALDDANGFRFMLLFDRTVSSDTTVEDLRVAFEQ